MMFGMIYSFRSVKKIMRIDKKKKKDKIESIFKPFMQAIYIPPKADKASTIGYCIAKGF